MSPRWRDHYLSTDQRPHYAYMKRVLQLLQWQRGVQKRWILKCPQHLEQLPVLLETFPDATIVFTHRDPVAVIQSTITMQAYTQRMQRPKVEMHALRDYWVDRIEHLLQAAVRDRDLVPLDRSVDCVFHLFMADQWAMLEQVYAKADMPLTPAARAELQRYMDDHPRGKGGQVVYDLRRDFHVDPERLYERFRFYTNRFPVKREVK
jgi:hypothetical protein